MNRIVFGLGRFNPPTRGHEYLISEVKNLASKLQATPVIFIVDGEKSGKNLEKNPMSGQDRRDLISYIHGVKTDIAGSAYEVLEIIDVMGLDPVGLVCGSDRVRQYESMIKYSGFSCPIVGLDRIRGLASNVSGTSAREAARHRSFEDFKRLMSPSMPDSLIEQVRSCIIEPGRSLDDIRSNKLIPSVSAIIAGNKG